MAKAQAIVMPKFGQTVEECTIVNWLKKEGDSVAKGEVLFEIETDKATLEVESFIEGTILKILAREGDTVPVQVPIGFIGSPGDEIPEAKIPERPELGKDEATGAPLPPRARAAVPEPRHYQPPSAPAPPTAAPPTPQPGRLKISPRAARLAREKVIDPSAITGTGPDGRIVEKDVLAYLESCGYDRRRISPAAKKLAAKETIDILSIRGTGDAGRILVADVERAIREKPRPLSKIRLLMGRRLTHSFTTTPHFFVTAAVDMTDLLALRAEMKARGSVYSVTDFVMKAVIMSLQEFPDVNSTTDGTTVRWHSKVHLGLAVSLEQGLIAPVIHDADDLSFADLHDRAADVAGKAREGKLLPDEMKGSTFTVSNMGMMDVENFTAIINPGESAILAVSSTIKKPVVKDYKIVIREIMKMTLSSDHRIIDGVMAAQFAKAIKNKLEDVELWKVMT